jgi:hypothetical protein
LPVTSAQRHHRLLDGLARDGVDYLAGHASRLLGRLREQRRGSQDAGNTKLPGLIAA